ncbi:MAG: DUF2203 domain-containing protein [Ignavibacteria bacterium]|nr:DUF2203 domain-containing protein [Ignavibacteria bacterium]MCC7158278.1 DUF2203 domain-containing protein [Ignavibacteria bacterium]
MSTIHTRHFSVEEANTLLDEIKPLIEEMIALKKKLDSKGYDVYNHQYFGGSGPNGKGAFPEEMERLVDIVRDISAEGVLIKGIDRGLIDFPHLRKTGEEVYLCWHHGEGEIQYWHTIPEGFSGRKNLDEL